MANLLNSRDPNTGAVMFICCLQSDGCTYTLRLNPDWIWLLNPEQGLAAGAEAGTGQAAKCLHKPGGLQRYIGVEVGAEEAEQLSHLPPASHGALKEAVDVACAALKRLEEDERQRAERAKREAANGWEQLGAKGAKARKARAALLPGFHLLLGMTAEIILQVREGGMGAGGGDGGQGAQGEGGAAAWPPSAAWNDG